jgi:broad-specificity NMP kinase
VTGTPGTGKSLFAKRISARVRNSRIIEVNDIVKAHRLYSGTDSYGSKIVRIKALDSALKKEVRNSAGLVLVVSHLVPDLNAGQRITVVLRLGLKPLMQRLRKRGYPKGKINENLIAEALDYCGAGVASKCPEVYEAESARDRLALMRYIIAVYGGKRRSKPKKASINKMGDLLRLINEGYSL